METRIAPWLSVADATRVVEFYQEAFGAVERERLAADDGSVVVANLAIGDADFWVQQDGESDPYALGGRSAARMILSVEDPDTVYAQAVQAGATEVFPVAEGHGWRLGRLVDPAGHHWEIGKRLTT